MFIAVAVLYSHYVQSVIQSIRFSIAAVVKDCVEFSADDKKKTKFNLYTFLSKTNQFFRREKNKTRKTKI